MWRGFCEHGMLVTLEGHEPPNLKPSHLTTHAFSTWSCLNPAAEGHAITHPPIAYHATMAMARCKTTKQFPSAQGAPAPSPTAANRSPQRIPIRTRSTRTPLPTNHSPINPTTNQHSIGLKHSLNHYCPTTAPILGESPLENLRSRFL